jgi:hypothetical protein
LNDTEQKLEQALTNSLSSVLTENEEIINKLDDIKTIAGWYKEAKEDPKKIPSIIVNRIIGELLNHSKEFFINSLTENIDIQCQIDPQHHEVKGDLHINFESVKPYVEFIKVVDGKKVPPPLRITFKVDIEGTLRGLKISSSPTIRVVQATRRKEISLDRFSFGLTISIIKLPAVKLVVPIVLHHKEHFKIEDLHFNL